LAAKIDESEKGFKERDERLKKQKNILLAANKNMTATKKLIGDKESEVARLLEQNEILSANATSVEEKNRHLETTAEELNDIIRVAEQSNFSHIDDYKKQVISLELQMAESKTEFQNYRARAQLVLQQNGSSGFEKRIEILESTIARLEKEIMMKSNEIHVANNRIKQIVIELGVSSDQVDILNGQMTVYKDRDVMLFKVETELNELYQKMRIVNEVHKNGKYVPNVYRYEYSSICS
jgi:chromosome segregation ATPase